jgi:hypothetical protein
VCTGYEVIAFGDINDFDGDVPDVQSSEPISSVLSILKGTAGGGAQDMYNIAEKVAQSERYTAWYDSQLEIAHILHTVRLLVIPRNWVFEGISRWNKLLICFI